MTGTVSVQPFNELIKKLREENFSKTADEINNLMQTAWTTSSEFIGELGLVLSRFRRERKSKSPELKRVLDECFKEVRKVWPDMK